MRSRFCRKWPSNQSENRGEDRKRPPRLLRGPPCVGDRGGPADRPRRPAARRPVRRASTGSSTRPTSGSSSSRAPRAGGGRDPARRSLRADARIRTADPIITSDVLYQLSYVGLRAKFGSITGVPGLPDASVCPFRLAPNSPRSPPLRLIMRCRFDVAPRFSPRFCYGLGYLYVTSASREAASQRPGSPFAARSGAGFPRSLPE
jgi:hypothetical protein